MILVVEEFISRNRLRVFLIIFGLVFVCVFPLLFIRSYHFEEGLTVALAKGALTDQPWYVPSLFGYRWVERPVMLSWIIAALSAPFGEVHQIIARLPTVLGLLAGAIAIAAFLDGRVSRLAGLFGAAAFVLSPVILQKVITAESDLILSVTQFAAFVVWWRPTNPVIWGS